MFVSQKVSEAATRTPTIHIGWHLLNGLEQCYTFNSNSLDWNQSASDCSTCKLVFQREREIARHALWEYF